MNNFVDFKNDLNISLNKTFDPDCMGNMGNLIKSCHIIASSKETYRFCHTAALELLENTTEYDFLIFLQEFFMNEGRKI